METAARPAFPVPPAASLLTTLLRDVSRSFYLTLRILPGTIRTPIGLAYLLARATDTIADTDLLPVPERLRALDQLRSRILGQSSAALGFSRVAAAIPALPPPPAAGEIPGERMEGGRSRAPGDPERALLERVEEALAVLDTLAADDRQRIRDVLATITSGQELDLQRFGEATERHIVALTSHAELDDYTYRVAGCVGEFWTGLCRARLFPNAPLDDAWLLARGIRFGQGLQLVNILRDVPADLRKGRCYVPGEILQPAGLDPAALLKPESEPRFRPVYQRLLGRAQQHLAAGWDYTNAIPWRCLRLRLACAWPLLIGAQTLARLRTKNVLDPSRPIKVSRADVRRLLLRSVALYPWPAAWRRQFGRIASS